MEALQQLVDSHAILETLYHFTHAQDEAHAATMVSLLIPDRKVIFDLSEHLPEVGKLEVSGAEMAQVLKVASATWSGTQHPVFNPVVTLMKDKARVKAMVQAYHAKGSDNAKVESVMVRATWNVEMEKKEEKWLIAGMKMKRGVPIENLDFLMGRPAEGVE